jgi:hypothetical protein
LGDANGLAVGVAGFPGLIVFCHLGFCHEPSLVSARHRLSVYLLAAVGALLACLGRRDKLHAAVRTEGARRGNPSLELPDFGIWGDYRRSNGCSGRRSRWGGALLTAKRKPKETHRVFHLPADVGLGTLDNLEKCRLVGLRPTGRHMLNTSIVQLSMPELSLSEPRVSEIHFLRALVGPSEQLVVVVCLVVGSHLADRKT